MSYPSDPSGGYPYGGPPPPPERSPWSSPIVLVAVAAGVLLVIAGVLAAFLLLPSDDAEPSSAAGSSTTTFTSTVTNSPGQQNPTAVNPTTVAPTTTTTTVPRPVPTVAGADWQGFSSGPRCNAADDPAIVIGQTSRSRVVICQVGTQTGRWYYKGQAGGGSIEISYPERSGDTFSAVNGSTTYVVSPSRLHITSNGQTVSDEPMIAYWSQ